MNRHLLAALIGMGISVTAVAQKNAGAPGQEEGALIGLPAVEAAAVDENGTINAAQADAMTTDLQKWLRFETVDSDHDGSIDDQEYVDAPTDTWRERLGLYRLV